MHRLLIFVSVLIIVPVLGPPACGASKASVTPDTVTFDIDRAPIAKALNRFARQTQVSIARPRISYRDGKSNALKGTYSLTEGLSRLLEGTGYGFERLGAGAIRVFRVPVVVHAPQHFDIEEGFDPFPIEEILVSTTRKPDRLQKLPYSISAITGSQREHLRAATSDDILHRISGIYVTKRGEGQGKIIIRGLSDGAFTGRAQSLVSTYMGFTRANYSAPDPSLRLYDVESVEVLRGPQGTLYGSGSLGGIYRIVPRGPSLTETELETGAGVGWTEGGDTSRDIHAVVNLPLLEDRLGLRAVAYYDRRGGYIDDIRLGRDNINDTTTKGGRAAVGAQLDDHWSLTVELAVQDASRDDSHYFNGDLDAFQRDNYVAEPRSDRFIQLSATVGGGWDWGDLTSTTSWIDRDIDQTLDGTRAVEWLVGDPNRRASPFETDIAIRTIVNETHVSSAPGGKLEWLAGFFFADRHEISDARLTVPGAELINILGVTDTIYAENLDDQIKEVALFGEITVFLSEQLSLTGGLRWYHYDDTAVSQHLDIGIGVDSTAFGEQRKSGLIPKLVLSYQAHDDLLLYAQLTEGYRVGGINFAGITFEGPIILPFEEPLGTLVPDTVLDNFASDELTTFELGAKRGALDGRLTVNLAGFYSNWRNIQSHQFSVGLPDVDNVGNARILGAEMDVVYRPTAVLELQMNASFNDSRITETSYRFGAEVGDILPAAPRFTFGTSGRYDIPLGASVLASISADYAYVGGSDLLFDKFSTPRNEAYHLANLRLSLALETWQLTAYINNVTNNRANIYAFGNPLALPDLNPGSVSSDTVQISRFQIVNQHTALRPRTVGLALSYRF